MVILKPSDIRQLLATSGKFVYTQAAVFSANMIGQGVLCPIFWWSGKFEPVKPNPYSKQRAWLLADCKQVFKMWIGNQMSPSLPANVASQVFFRIYVLGKKYCTSVYHLHQEFCYGSFIFLCVPTLSPSPSLLHNHAFFLSNSRLRPWNT